MTTRSWRALLAALLLALGIGALSPATPASAHASVSSTTPADGAVSEDRPESVTIVFNENVTLAQDSVRLIDSSGAAQGLTQRSTTPRGSGVEAEWDVPSDLEEGWYAVAWRAVSADGHPISGSFTFFYGDPDAAAGAEKADAVKDPTAPYVTAAHIIRGLSYLAVLLAVGLLLATWAFAGPLTALDRPGLAVGARRWATGAAIAGLLLTPLALLNSAVILNGGSFDSIGVIVQIILQSSTGAALLVRMSALFGLCTAVLLLAEQNTRKVGAAVGALAGAAVMYSLPMGGHAAVVPWSWVARISETVHLLAAAAWLGGIPAVAVATRRRLSSGTLVEVVERFSRIATISVVAVLIAGTTLSVAMFTSPAEIVTTAYGVSLIVKFLLVATVAAAGAYNHFFLIPSLRRELENADGSDTEGAAADSRTATRTHLRRTLLGEAGMLLAVVTATAVLTSFAAPAAGDNHFAGGGHSHGGGAGLGFELDIALEDLDPKIVRVPFAEGEARLDYLPGRAGAENRFALSITDRDGAEIAVERAVAVITQEQTGIGPLEREFVRENDGSQTLITRDFGVAGTWTMEVTVTLPGGSLDTATFTVEIEAKQTTPEAG